MKTLVLVCCSENALSLVAEALKHAQKTEASFAVANPPLVNSLYCACRQQIGGERDLFIHTRFDDWARSISSVFPNLIQRELLSDTAAVETLVLLSVENSLFIGAWRDLCEKLEIKLRVVHVRNFAWSQGAENNFDACEYVNAVHVAMQAGTDTFCLTAKELEQAGESAISMIMKGFGADVPSLLFDADPEPCDGWKLPLELQMLGGIFKGSSMGALFPVNGSRVFADNIAFLKLSTHPNSAFSRCFRKGSSGVSPESGKLFMYEERIAALLEATRTAQAKAVTLKKKLGTLEQELRACGEDLPDIKALLAFISGENKTINLRKKKTMQLPRPKGKSKPKKSTIRRKLTKLRKNFEAFCKDSQHATLRFIGHALFRS